MKTMTVLLGLGVVGVGVIGAVALSKKAAAQPSGPQPQGPGPVPTPVPGLTPPAPVPGVPSGGEGLVFVNTPTSIHLRQNQYYRGRVNLGGSGILANLPPFTAGASEETIGKGLVALGFVDVRVFMDASHLPSDWPKTTALNPQPGTRWFQGQWSGITADVPSPPQVEQVWVTASPALVQARAAQTISTSGIGAVMSG